MIEINGECDNVMEELRPRKYVRRDFAPGHREELLPLVFLPYFYPPSRRVSLLPLLQRCTGGRFYRIKNTAGRLRHRIPFCHPSIVVPFACSLAYGPPSRSESRIAVTRGKKDLLTVNATHTHATRVQLAVRRRASIRFAGYY